MLISVVPLVGFSPISHVGHRDLRDELSKRNGKHFVGVSRKDEYFGTLKKRILQKQWGDTIIDIVISESAGRTLKDCRPQQGDKFDIVVGKDRKAFAERLRKSIIDGNIKEINDLKFSEKDVTITCMPERTHEYSGTRMRQACFDLDFETFQEHIGLTDEDFLVEGTIKSIMIEIRNLIIEGKISIKRKK